MTKLLCGVLFAFTLAACGSSVGPSDSSAVRSTTDPALNGIWTSHTLKVEVAIDLTWTRDSVRGTGTFGVRSAGMGCGGGTLSGNGDVTFAAARSGDQIAGVMHFANGWSPPYRGVLSSSSINGELMSVDAGPCPFSLYHGLVP